MRFGPSSLIGSGFVPNSSANDRSHMKTFRCVSTITSQKCTVNHIHISFKLNQYFYEKVPENLQNS